jgi:putative sigma-54 modulation protein
MKLQVHWNGLTGTPTLRAHLERRLAFALDRFGDEINHVCARLADLNGPRGGVDKLVSLRVNGRRLKSLMVTDSDSDFFAAIDRAAERIGRAIGRTLERKNSRAHRHDDLLPERARTQRRR